MKKFTQLCAVIAIIIFLIPQPVMSSSMPMTEETVNTDEITINSSFGLDAGNTLLGPKKIIDNARAAIVFETGSQTLMYAWNADDKLYPASFVKLMTGLIAVEEGNLADVVTVSDSAVSSLPVDAISADLLAGETMPLQDLLYCLLVSSANDAAIAIAEHIAGSQDRFVNMMNSRAQELGCLGTTFKNVHGLHDSEQLTTARDVAKILDTALQNESFRKIFTTSQHSVAATNKTGERLLLSSNSLLDSASKLYYDERVLGGRTGVAQDGRRCIASLAEKNGMSLICVVMGSDTVYQEDGYSAITVGGYKETTALLDAGFEGNKYAQILHGNQALRQCVVENGDSDLIVGPNESVSAILPEAATAENLTFHYVDRILKAPIAAGEKVSVVQVWYENICVVQADLYAMNSVNTVDSLQVDQNEDPKSFEAGTALLIVVIILLVAFGVFITVRMLPRLRFWARKIRNKRYRRNRRRSR